MKASLVNKAIVRPALLELPQSGGSLVLKVIQKFPHVSTQIAPRSHKGTLPKSPSFYDDVFQSIQGSLYLFLLIKENIHNKNFQAAYHLINSANLCIFLIRNPVGIFNSWRRGVMLHGWDNKLHSSINFIKTYRLFVSMFSYSCTQKKCCLLSFEHFCDNPIDALNQLAPHHLKFDGKVPPIKVATGLDFLNNDQINFITEKTYKLYSRFLTYISEIQNGKDLNHLPNTE